MAASACMSMTATRPSLQKVAVQRSGPTRQRATRVVAAAQKKQTQVLRLDTVFLANHCATVQSCGVARVPRENHAVFDTLIHTAPLYLSKHLVFAGAPCVRSRAVCCGACSCACSAGRNRGVPACRGGVSVTVRWQACKLATNTGFVPHCGIASCFLIDEPWP